MLVLTLNEGESVSVGGDVVFKFQRFDGNRIRVAVKAPREVPILRTELLERPAPRKPV